MLEKIFQTIEKKSADEAAKIIKEKDAAILALEQDYQKEAGRKRDGAKAALQKKGEDDIEELKQRKGQELSFLLQAEKNKIIASAYSAGQEAFAGISDDDFEKWAKALSVSLSALKAGDISAGKRTAKALKRILHNRDFTIKEELEEEGFIFRSDVLEIDARLSQLLKEQKEKTEPLLAKILFS